MSDSNPLPQPTDKVSVSCDMLPNEANTLHDRVRFLEETLEVNAYAMDVLASTTAIFGDAECNRSPEQILQHSLEAIRCLLTPCDMAVYLLDTESSFNLAWHEDSKEHGDDLPRVVEELIQEGTFSWALHQNHPICLPARIGEDSVLLHVISTRTRIRGMFAARFRPQELQRHEMALTMLTLLLFNAAYALENAELFQTMKRRQEALQRISERQSRELLRHMSHDSLTGLPNRQIFTEQLSQTLQRHRGTSQRIALVLLDLDHFKRLGLTLGHRAGEELIRKLSQDLSQLLQRSLNSSGQPLRTTLARLDRDEFGILVEHMEDQKDCMCLVTEIVRTVAIERTIFGQSVVTSASCGIATFPHDSEEVHALIGNAEAAVYEAKQRGRNGFRFYTQELTPRTSGHFQRAQELGRAIQNEELILHYQPQVDLVSGRILGAEALVRWQHPKLGLLSPADFIELAEDMTLIEEIGEWVFAQVCRDLNQVQCDSGDLPRIAVNVSARQLRQSSLAGNFQAILQYHDIPADRIELELTETAIMDDPQGARRVFQQLREIGVSLAVDDFGTGQASLTQLKQIPADTLKIDRSFVKDLKHGDNDGRIIQAIVQIAWIMGQDIVAEGVETADQAQWLLQAGCKRAQGYHFSRPIPFHELQNLLQDDRSLPLTTDPTD